MKIHSTTRDSNIKFNSSSNSYSNTKFRKTNNMFRPKTAITPTEQDIYLDEIIYYDGGNVKGYGDS